MVRHAPIIIKKYLHILKLSKKIKSIIGSLEKNAEVKGIAPRDIEPIKKEEIAKGLIERGPSKIFYLRTIIIMNHITHPNKYYSFKISVKD